MKIIIGLCSVALSFSALAVSVDTQTFRYDGSQSSTELHLHGEKSHTEYKVENVLTTCYRNEIVGYSTICTNPYPYPYPRYPGPGYPGPHYPGPHYPGPGGHHHPHNNVINHISTCYQQPIYRNVAYSCYQDVSTPYEVKDYDVDARVIVDVTNLSNAVTPGEKINVSLIGETLQFEAVGSKKFFLVKKHQDVQSTMNGSVKMLDGVLAVELVEAAPVLKAMSMTNIEIKNSVLNFNIGEVSSRNNIDFSLKITKKKIFGSDPVLLDRKLSTDEAKVSASASGATVAVDLNTLGVDLTGGKFSLTATAKVKTNGPIMNASEFSKLEASRTLIYTSR